MCINIVTEICEDPEFPRPYMMKRADPHESFYAATDIIHHVSTFSDKNVLQDITICSPRHRMFIENIFIKYLNADTLRCFVYLTVVPKVMTS